MDDLYERLLAEVASLEGAIPQPGGTCEALAAVLEVHKPKSRADECCTYCGGDPAHDHCSARGCGWVWPCETVRAIARALDVPIGDQQ